LLSIVISLTPIAMRSAIVHDASHARAWLPGFFGVHHIEVMQNSPQRHVSSLYGQ